jgi:formyltetrahydrofolate deformylase
MNDAAHTARLLVACPDAKGLVADITRFIAEHGGNVLDLDQHTDPDDRMFFARVVFDLCDLDISLTDFESRWKPVADGRHMQWRIHDATIPRRVAILVGKTDHCLRELLWRWEDGELPCDIAFVAGNHDTLAPLVKRYDLIFHHVPADANARDDHESRLTDLIDDASVDVVVLARYMRILSPDFVARYPSRVINIHHSFLPAFAGARPYHQAHLRGVKLIGATCHFVTDELDAGPIIEQATAHVGHRDTVSDLIRKGKDLERSALLNGLRLHLQDRVIVHGSRTIVFD